MKTINHECYVSLEVAKLLKKAGFDWEVNHSYPNISALDNSCSGYMEDLSFYHNLNDGKYGGLSAPTLEVAQRWLREVEHLDISIHYDPTIKSQPYAYSIYDVEEKFDNIFGIISPITHSYSDGYFYKYEEAQEGGIKKALEIILEKGE